MAYYLSSSLANRNGSVIQIISGSVPSGEAIFVRTREFQHVDISPSAEYILETSWYGTGSHTYGSTHDYDPSLVIWQSSSTDGYERKTTVGIKGSRSLTSNAHFIYADAPNYSAPIFINDNTILWVGHHLDEATLDGPYTNSNGVFGVISGSGDAWGFTQIFTGSTTGLTGTNTSQGAGNNPGTGSISGDIIGDFGDAGDLYAYKISTNNIHSGSLPTRAAVHQFNGHPSDDGVQGRVTIFKCEDPTWSFHSQFKPTDFNSYIQGTFNANTMGVQDVVFIDEDNIVVVWYQAGDESLARFSWLMPLTFNNDEKLWKPAKYTGSELGTADGYASVLNMGLDDDHFFEGRGHRWLQYDPYAKKLLIQENDGYIYGYHSASGWLTDTTLVNANNSRGLGATLEVQMTSNPVYGPFVNAKNTKWHFADGRATGIGLENDEDRHGFSAAGKNVFGWHESSSTGGWTRESAIISNKFRSQDFNTGSHVIQTQSAPINELNAYNGTQGRSIFARSMFAWNANYGGDANRFFYREGHFDNANIDTNTAFPGRIPIFDLNAFPASSGGGGSPGITVSPTELVLTENQDGEITVVLDAQPASDVQITASLHSDFDARATLTNHLLTFTNANWNTPQILQVTASNDNIVNGPAGPDPITFSVVDINSDDAYDGLSATATLTVNDNDTAGFTLGTGSLFLTESQDDTVSVVLNKQPLGNVKISASLRNVNFAGRASLTNHVLTFTAGNWNVPQLLQVTASDDNIINGTEGPHSDGITFSIVQADTTALFDGVADQTVELTVFDNDSAGIILGTGSLFLTESQDDTVSVRLAAQPDSNVVITASLHSNFNSRATLTNHLITFTNANWNTPQLVQVTASDDNIVNGDVGPNNITFSVVDADSDNNFDGISNTVALTVFDNDSAGIIHDPTSLSLTESQDGEMTVRLSAQPASNVVVTASLHSSLESRATLTNHLFTFTPANWNTPQILQVTASDDSIVNGPLGRSDGIVFSVVDVDSDNTFDGITDDAGLIIFDNDVAGFTLGTGSLFLTESQDDTVSVVLNKQPLGNVQISASLRNVNFAGRASLTNHVLTFTAGNWNVPQLLQVTASDDNLINGTEGPHSDGITFSIVQANTTSLFDSVADQTVELTVFDNDGAGITLGTGSLFLTESQDDTVSVRLAAQPDSNVVITASLHSSFDTRATLTNHLITFTNANWNTPQLVQVTASDDNLINGDVGPNNITFSVVDADSDNNFDGISSTVALTVFDNDSAGIILGTGSLFLTESQDDTVSVRLAAQPNSNVVITASLHSNFDGRATLTNHLITFTNANWNTPQLLQVTASDDNIVNGDVGPNNITLSVVDADSDNNFDGVSSTVALTVFDNDTAGFTLGTGSLFLTESQDDTVSVVLTKRPLGNVQISASLRNVNFDGRASLTNHLITFTNANWNVPQLLQVTASDDLFVNGTEGPHSDGITFSIVQANTTALFDGVANQTVALTVFDNDNAGFMSISRVGHIFGTDDLIVTETGGEDELKVRLSARPTSNVTITITGVDATEFTISDTQLVFTSDNWNIDQTLRFKGLPDNVDNDNTITTITLTAASSDAAFNGESMTRKVTNLDTVPAGGFDEPCTLLDIDYTINYYQCALGQYSYHKTLPFRLGCAQNVSNIRQQSAENSHETFLGEPKT